MPRIQIHTADIITVMGVSKRTACRYMAEIRDSLKKESHQKITVGEFAQYFGFKEYEVREAMKITQNPYPEIKKNESVQNASSFNKTLKNH